MSVSRFDNIFSLINLSLTVNSINISLWNFKTEVSSFHWKNVTWSWFWKYNFNWLLEVLIWRLLEIDILLTSYSISDSLVLFIMWDLWKIFLPQNFQFSIKDSFRFFWKSFVLIKFWIEKRSTFLRQIGAWKF